MIWSTVLSFLTGPNGIYAILVAAIGIALAWARQSGRKSALNETKAKEADALEKHYADVAAAGSARPSGSLSDDPRNRDR